MLPTAERHGLMGGIFPVDPEPGEICTPPEGQEAGASYVLALYIGGEALGHTSQVSRVPNVSRRSHLNRTVTTAPLKEGAEIEVRFTRYAFKSARFVESFGWVGHELGPDPEVHMSQRFKVIAFLKIEDHSSFFVYDKVCLEALKE